MEEVHCKTYTMVSVLYGQPALYDIAIQVLCGLVPRPSPLSAHFKRGGIIAHVDSYRMRKTRPRIMSAERGYVLCVLH